MEKRSEIAAPERRFIAVDVPDLEIRSEGDGNRLVGYAAVFNSLSEDLGGFREQIAPGTFAESIAADDVRALWNHDPSQVLGRTRSRTLWLAEDGRGLRFSLDLPDTQLARDLKELTRRRDVSQMSFGFRTIDDEWATQDGMPMRTLRKVRLFDVSPVTFPAYPDTTVALRSRDAWTAAAGEAAPKPEEIARRAAERSRRLALAGAA